MRQIINFTGMDGSGKTTALQKFATILRNRGFTVQVVCSGYFDSAVHEFISLFEQEIKSDHTLERFIHTLDFHMVLKNLGKLDLKNIDFILFDRHFLDKRVFFELRTGQEWPAFFEKLIPQDFYPQINLYFRVEPRTAARRLSRQRAVFDWKESLEMLERAPVVYEKYLSKDTAARIDIDANCSENLVLNQVMTGIIGSKFV
jgi:thymidylate kinase